MKLLRTIRLDASDTFVFVQAAAPGEWAVPGGFTFWDVDSRALSGRERQAFRAGFLGLSSFGWATLAVVTPVTAEERSAAVAALAAHLVAAHGAPDLDAAKAAAEDEIAVASELAAHPEGTLIALHRTVDADGSLREQFRTLSRADARQTAQMPCSAGAFAIVEDEASDAEADSLSLVGLAARRTGGRA